MRTISSDDGIITLRVELDETEAVAERVGEHGEPAIGRVAGLAFLHRPGGDDSLYRRVHVLDNEIGMDRVGCRPRPVRSTCRQPS